MQSCVFAWSGVSLAGRIDPCGLGKPVETEMLKSPHELWGSREKRNNELLAGLREDKLSMELLKVRELHGAHFWCSSVVCQVTEQDAGLGRMSHPVPIEQICVEKYLLNPRFAVAQDKEDGSTKVRPIDNFSWGEMPSEVGRRRP